MNYLFKILFFLFFFLSVLNSRAFSQDVFIVSSSDIIPFKTCVEGIKESMSDFSLKISNIEEDLKKGDEVLAEIREKNPKITIAVGPKAAFVLSQDHDLLPKIFCMVLNPDKLLAQNGMYPGVSLNIPPEFQLETIMKAFPERKRIGVFFNKKSNQSTIDKFYEEAKNLNVVLVRFPILSANDIPAIINSKEFSIDVLLVIPDSKIESTKIAEYIIEESLRRKIPVVGYNSWFVKNGALLSFIIDYREVGIQTGQAAKRMISEGSSIYNGIIPLEKITISLDLKTAKKLGVRISPEIIQKATEVIE